MRRLLLTAVCGAALLASGCSEEPASNSTAAAAPEEPEKVAAASSTPAFDLTADEVVTSLNRWRVKLDQTGGYLVTSDEPVDAGKDKGGKSRRACADPNNCVLITSRPDGQVTDAVLLQNPGETNAENIAMIGNTLSFMRVFEPEDERIATVLNNQFSAALDNMREGKIDDQPWSALSHSCVKMMAGASTGVWTLVKPPPCTND